MKFQPTIHLTNQAISDIREGKLQLQCGQWVTFDGDNFKCRFIGITKAGVLWVVHSQPDKPTSMTKFTAMRNRIQLFERLYS